MFKKFYLFLFIFCYSLLFVGYNKKENIQNYKQYDGQWAGAAYSGSNILWEGCGPTSVANIVGDNPIRVGEVSSQLGQAAPGSGSQWTMPAAVLNQYGWKATLHNAGNIYGSVNSQAEQDWLNQMKHNNAIGVLCVGPSRFTQSGHFITVLEVDGNNSCYIHDPASPDNDGWIPWSDIQGRVKSFTSATKVEPVPPEKKNEKHRLVKADKDTEGSQWLILGDKVITIENVLTKSFLSYSNRMLVDNNLKTYDKLSEGKEKQMFELREPPHRRDIPGLYMIVPKADESLCLTEKENGDIVLAKIKEDDSSQYWLMQEQLETVSTFKIQNVGSNNYLNGCGDYLGSLGQTL